MIDIIAPVIFTYLWLDSYQEQGENMKKDLTSREAVCKMTNQNRTEEELQKCIKRMQKN